MLPKQKISNLYTHLRHQSKSYRKRYRKYDYRGRISNRADIDHWPAIVDEKIRLNDWEADTVICKGHQGLFVTLTERVFQAEPGDLPVSQRIGIGQRGDYSGFTII